MKLGPSLQFTRASLDALYDRYNRREFVHPDPLEFLYGYEDASDREVVGIVASSLAYGRVKQILKSVSVVLARMGPSPSSFLLETPGSAVRQTFTDFKHRFTTGDQLAALLLAVKSILLRCGSLQACFMAGLKDEDLTILSALTAFTQELNANMNLSESSMLLPSPLGGSACKRLNLFLRWMVRRDDVDPGGWSLVSPSRLIVPLDTHMHRIGKMMGLTSRKQADLRAAIEITEAFRSIAPGDPVRYDFALTRLGIRDDIEV